MGKQTKTQIARDVARSLRLGAKLVALKALLSPDLFNLDPDTSGIRFDSPMPFSGGRLAMVTHIKSDRRVNRGPSAKVEIILRPIDLATLDGRQLKATESAFDRAVEAMFAHLTLADYQVLMLSSGLRSAPLSLRDLARLFRCSQERIRAIKARSERSLKGKLKITLLN